MAWCVRRRPANVTKFQKLQFHSEGLFLRPSDLLLFFSAVSRGRFFSGDVLRLRVGVALPVISCLTIGFVCFGAFALSSYVSDSGFARLEWRVFVAV